MDFLGNLEIIFRLRHPAGVGSSPTPGSAGTAIYTSSFRTY